MPSLGNATLAGQKKCLYVSLCPGFADILHGGQWSLFMACDISSECTLPPISRWTTRRVHRRGRGRVDVSITSIVRRILRPVDNTFTILLWTRANGCTYIYDASTWSRAATGGPPWHGAVIEKKKRVSLGCGQGQRGC